MLEEFLWVQRYRPKTVAETILPPDIKNIFQKFVDQKNIPNLILSGGAGIGKTTVACAMLEELNCDYIVINSSLDRGIETIRVEIMGFASSVSFTGGRKYVILDEADNLTHDSQRALRAFTEQFSTNCGFILTCNYKNKLIDALHSRCPVIDFKIAKKDLPKLAMQFMKRTEQILDKENVTYDKAVLAEVIQKYCPDWRRTLNELQNYSATGSIDSGILNNMLEKSIVDLIVLMKEKNFTGVRKWIKDSLDTDMNILYTQFYETGHQYFPISHIPLLVTIIAKYQYQNAFAANVEINFAAFCAEVMVEMSFL